MASNRSATTTIIPAPNASAPGIRNACKARYYRGDILRAMKKYREAADEFMMIEDAFPGCPLKGRALLGAGESLIAAGDSPAAAAVLRRLSETEKDDEVLPRAMFSLAVALDNIGRDLEAGGVLETLVSKHPESPVSALALLRLGDGAVAAGDLGKGVEYYRKAADRHKEKSLRERSILKLIETLERSGAMDEALKESSGPESIACLSSAKCTNEENYLMQKLMRAAVGTNNVDHCARL